MQLPTRIPDCLGDTPNIFYLFLTSNPSAYSVRLFSPLGSSNHNLISVTCSIALVQSQDPPKRRCFWHFNSAKWEDLGQHYSDFPLDDYCFHVRDLSFSLCRVHNISDCFWHGVIDSSHFFLILKRKRPGLTLLVLMLSKIERRLTNSTIAIHLLKLMPFTFLPVSMSNAFSSLLNTHSSIENFKIFPILTLLEISGI